MFVSLSLHFYNATTVDSNATHKNSSLTLQPTASLLLEEDKETGDKGDVALEQRQNLDSEAHKNVKTRFESKYSVNVKWWDDIWHNELKRLAKPFEPHIDKSWCSSSSEGTGLYFTKVPKCASSTNAAISMQMAENVAKRLNQSGPCPTNVHHGSQYKHRKNPFLLWTNIRDPAKRAISHYFFRRVGRMGEMATVEGMMRNVNGTKNFMLDYIFREKEVQTHSKFWLNKIESALDAYHFIGLAERQDESHVLMKLLFDLEYEDVLTLSSKVSGGYDPDHSCTIIPKSFLYPEVAEYIDSREYQQGNYDYLLHAVVNRSLDLTIEMLGRDRVEQEMAKVERLRNFIEDQCYAQAIFPCNPDGSKPNCYFSDVGCGHECVYEKMEECKRGLIKCPL